MQQFLNDFFNPTAIPGHISYCLLITSMLMRRMLFLRLFAIGAGSFSGTYYALHGDSVLLFWEFVFTSVNVIQLLILLIENRLSRFTPEEQTFIDRALRGVEKAHARRLIRLGEWREVGDGTTLIDEDTTPSHLYFIVNGAADIRRHGRNVGVVGPGDFLGEMSYLTGKQATATVTTVTPVRVLCFERETLHAHLAKNPEVRHSLEGGFNRNLVDKLVKINVADPEMSGNPA
jgi:hypothetical protein